MSRRLPLRQPWRQFSLRTLGLLIGIAAFITLSYAIPRRSAPFGAFAEPPVFLSGESLTKVRVTILPALLLWYAGWAIVAYSYGYDRTGTAAGARRWMCMSIFIGSIVLMLLQAVDLGPLRFFY